MDLDNFFFYHFFNLISIILDILRLEIFFSFLYNYMCSYVSYFILNFFYFILFKFIHYFYIIVIYFLFLFF